MLNSTAYECIASYEPMASTNGDPAAEELYQRKSSIKPGNGNQKPNTAAQLKDRLKELQTERSELGLCIFHKYTSVFFFIVDFLYIDKLRSSTAFQRNFVYPVAMLLLLFLTGLTVLIVVQNTLELLIGLKALPLSTPVGICWKTKI